MIFLQWQPGLLVCPIWVALILMEWLLWQVVALVGPSGGGKSSIVKLIEQFYTPSAGTVRFDGREVGVYNSKWLKRRVAIVNQARPQPQFCWRTVAPCPYTLAIAAAQPFFASMCASLQI